MKANRLVMRIGKPVTLLIRRLTGAFLARRGIERCYMFADGHVFFQTLSAAVRLDLFSLLAKHERLTQAEIVSHLNLTKTGAHSATRLHSFALLKKTGDTDANSAVADSLPPRQSPKDFRAVVLWQHFFNYRAMFAFHESIQSNRNCGLDTL